MCQLGERALGAGEFHTTFFSPKGFATVKVLFNSYTFILLLQAKNIEGCMLYCLMEYYKFIEYRSYGTGKQALWLNLTIIIA